jgi:outer membrane protein OmpA-like peptidoglycan-associated protein
VSPVGWGARGAPRSGGGATPGGAGNQLSVGITDLMTSLAVIFVLLLVVFASPPHAADAPAPPPRAPEPDPAETTREALTQLTHPGPILESDVADPHVLRVLVPESLLNFEFGRSALTTPADRFLREIMPVYARAMCGPLRERIAGIVIEGHTDDRGSDALNLRLSQERSFRVLVRGLELIREVDPDDHDCFAALASASGRGKQDLVYNEERRPDRQSSRRVVFKILLRPAVAPS